jgi:hypothetical protein
LFLSRIQERMSELTRFFKLHQLAAHSQTAAEKETRTTHAPMREDRPHRRGDI